MYPPVQPSPLPNTPAVARAAPYKWRAPTLELTPQQVKDWWSRIELDRNKRNQHSENWKRLLTAYLPPFATVTWDNIKGNIHFTDTELKSAEVWAQFPELTLTPQEPLKTLQGPPDPQTGQPTPVSADDVVAIKRAVLNKLLGRDFANVDLTVREVLFDIFQTSGIGFTKICYESDIKLVPPTPPTPVPGAILGLSQPAPAPAPLAVNERWRWYRFSPEKGGIPYNYHSTDWDRSPYLFMEFVEPYTPQSAKAYNLPSDWKPTASRDELTLNAEPDHQGSSQLIKGVEVWLHAADFDENEPDRDVFYRLVLIDGMKDKAAIYEFSPYQEKDEQGHLTFDSMIGNPIHPITLRVASDTAYIPSDAAMTDPLIQMEDTWIQQDIKIRDANLPRFAHAASLTAAFDKLQNADTGQGVAIADDLMMRFPQLVQPLPHLDRAESDIQGRQQIVQMRQQTLGLTSNSLGMSSQARRSATEQAIIQQNISVRLKKEQAILLSEVLRGVRKFDALVQRYMTNPGYVQIIGQDGMQRLQAFTNAHLSGRYAYDALPDSQLSVDQASRTKRIMDVTNFTAKSSVVDQPALMRLVFTENGYNAAQLVKPPPPPPPPKPDLPNISYTFKAQDLAIPEVRAILGVAYPQLAQIFQAPVSPEAQLASAGESAKLSSHGGAADKVDLLDKHTSEKTGLQPGVHPLQPVPALPVHPALPMGTHPPIGLQ